MAMNILPPGTRPANPPHVFVVPATATVPTPANDNHRCWTQDSRARLLLASMVSHPPRGEWKQTRYVQTSDRWFEYVGYRADALDAIRLEHGDRAHAAYHAAGDTAYSAFNAWCHQPSVTQAIDGALEAAEMSTTGEQAMRIAAGDLLVAREG